MRLQCTKTKQSKQIQTPSTICNVFYGKIKTNSYKVKNFNESLPGQQVRTEHTRLPSCGLSSLQPEQKFQHSKAINRKTKHGSKFCKYLQQITIRVNDELFWIQWISVNNFLQSLIGLTFAVRSCDPVATNLSFGDITTQLISFSWTLSVWIHFRSLQDSSPVLGSCHFFRVKSWPPLTIQLAVTLYEVGNFNQQQRNKFMYILIF